MISGGSEAAHAFSLTHLPLPRALRHEKPRTTPIAPARYLPTTPQHLPSYCLSLPRTPPCFIHLARHLPTLYGRGREWDGTRINICSPSLFPCHPTTTIACPPLLLACDARRSLPFTMPPAPCNSGVVLGGVAWRTDRAYLYNCLLCTLNGTHMGVTRTFARLPIYYSSMLL